MLILITGLTVGIFIGYKFNNEINNIVESIRNKFIK